MKFRFLSCIFSIPIVFSAFGSTLHLFFGESASACDIPGGTTTKQPDDKAPKPTPRK